MPHHYTLLCLMLLFIAKHFICDFPLQYRYMVEQKGTYGAIGGLHHAGIHALATILILLMFIHPLAAVMAGLLDGFLHYHIDWAKQNLSRHVTSRDREFWMWLGLDQAFHYTTYTLIMGLIIYD